MAKVLLTNLKHNGEFYPENTPVSKVKDLSEDEVKLLEEAGSVGEPVVHQAIQDELDAKESEIASLKQQLEDLKANKSAGATQGK